MRSINLDYENYRWVGKGIVFFEDESGYMYERKSLNGAVYYSPLPHAHVKCRKEVLNSSCVAKIKTLHEKGWSNPSSYVQILYGCGATGNFEEVRKMVVKEIQRLNELARQKMLYEMSE